MNTGYNTDVEHQGRVFHVQTEDKGLDNPIVETLIYCGGEILTSRRSSYEQLVGTERHSEEEVQRRMEAQHQGLIREIRNGGFDQETLRPFGYNIVSNRSFDEVVLTFLEEFGPTEPIRLELIDWQVIQEDTRPTLRLRVLADRTDGPVEGADVKIVVEPSGGSTQELFSSITDEDGFLEASFSIPKLINGSGELVCTASGLNTTTEHRQPIERISRKRKSVKTA
jgi:hypothetical protein